MSWSARPLGGRRRSGRRSSGGPSSRSRSRGSPCLSRTGHRAVWSSPTTVGSTGSNGWSRRRSPEATRGIGARATTLGVVPRGSAYVLLAVVGVGVFLAGLELMVPAVALPSILADLADPTLGSAWVELRKASWIINGYLLVYILTMPMAGR